MALLRNTVVCITAFLITCHLCVVSSNNHKNRTSTKSTTAIPEIAEEEPTEPSYCYDGAMLQNFCKVPDDMEDLGFWDINAVMFSDVVIDALVYGCTKGTWCLRDRFDFWDAQILERADMVLNSEIGTNMCNKDITPCFDKISTFFRNCSQGSQIEFTTEAIKLMCHLRNNPDVPQECIKQTLVSLHVTVADVKRKEEFVPNADVDQNSCDGADMDMTQRLICMENSCPGEQAVFRHFNPWLWFTKSVGELIDQCALDPSKCINVLKPLLEEEEAIYIKELGAIVGGCLAAIIILMTSLACVLYRRHRRNAVVKEGYQKLLNDGDRS